MSPASYAPADTPPHALVRGIEPGVCTVCHHLVREGGRDPVHSLPGVCERCAGVTEPGSTLCGSCLVALAEARAAAQLERLAAFKPPPPAVPGSDWDLPDNPRSRSEPDMSPEAVAARAERKRLHAEAVAYVADYHGTWGLPLDIRANPKWGTKYLRLSEAQVDALIRGRDRDREREAAAADDPRQLAARAFLVAQSMYRAGFEADMVTRARAGVRLSEGQLAAVERWQARESSPIVEGMYRTATGDIFKVQRAVHGSRQLYAKHLIVSEGQSRGEFEYEPGALGKLSATDRMTVEEAAEFGKLYGWCCVCGRQLTDEQSIAAGIGPVCASRV